MDVGDQVEVHTTFNDAWVRGFEIAEVANAGYRVRRVSDGVLLPDPTSEVDLRPVPSTTSPPA
ncbi:MAG: hypothetical protein QOE63_371 [Acidimicrobiaceae bacterium]|jgi:hypothetical protein